MFPPADMFSLSTLFSAYASITYIIMLIRTLFDDLIPHQVQNFLWSKFGFLFNPRSSCSSSQLTLVIDEYTRNGYGYRNKLYKASQLFLGTKITPSIKKIIVSKFCRDKDIVLTIPAGEEVIDIFEGIQVKWKLIANNPDDNDDEENSGNSFEVEFHKKDREKVLSYYLAYVLSIAKALKQQKQVRKLHTIEPRGNYWQSVILEHPATFDTLAIDHKLKREIIEDLDRFVRRRELYKKVGKAWKRGYLLYGPPGTGKSTLVAAMANYLKFDVYDMELSSVHSNDDLRRYLLETTNRSILLIEDIDCSINLQNREQDSEDDDSDEDDNSDEDDDDSEPHGSKNKVTLSGLLNFVDGLWSSCGDERIIIFTTNHKDRLDEALLRPGRMDMHIHLSYCTTEGFNILALNYLGLHKNTDKLYSEIEASIEKCQVTPADEE